MKTTRLLPLSALALGLATISAAAQMPTDNAAWQSRCDTLHNAVTPITGAAPVWLQQAPGKTPGPQWTEFGWDRDRAGSPAIACVFFYLGAIADHQMPPTHANKIHARESSTMGLIEWEKLHKIPVTARQSLTRDHAMLAEIPKPPLTSEGELAMVETSRVLPTEPPAAGAPVLASNTRH